MNDKQKQHKKNLRLKRGTAERLVGDVLARVKRFRNPFVRIGRVAVFGSFLDSSKDRIGDLDITVEIVRTPKWSTSAITNGENIPIWAISKAERSWFYRLAWPDDHAYRTIRGNSRAISVHDWREVEQMGCPYKVIYPLVRA